MKATTFSRHCSRVMVYILMATLICGASLTSIKAQIKPPVIKSVTIAPPADPSKSTTLNIQIDGSGFGSDSEQTTVILYPDIDGQFKNIGVTDGRIIASFDAPKDYKPNHVTVVIGGKASNTWDSTSSPPVIAIKSARVIRGQNSPPGVSRFDVTVDGNSFGHDPEKINLIPIPGDGVKSPSKIDFISASGTTIQASFEADSDYWPESVSIVVGKSHKTYKIPANANGGIEPSQIEEIRVYRSIMPPEDVADVFGRRISRRFVAVQVTVTNRSKDFQYLIHDISLDLTKILKTPLPYELSSRDLSLLRGVAEKGQIYDRRNFTVRLLEVPEILPQVLSALEELVTHTRRRLLCSMARLKQRSQRSFLI